MSELVTSSAGTRIYIGTAMPGTENKAGYESVSWTEVGDITDGGEFGKEFETIRFNPLATRRTEKRKGAFDEGTMELQMGRAPSDAGQLAMLGALDSDDTFPFKVVLQDSTHIYFGAQVMSYRTRLGTVNDVTQATGRLEITTDILETTAPGT